MIVAPKVEEPITVVTPEPTMVVVSASLAPETETEAVISTEIKVAA